MISQSKEKIDDSKNAACNPKNKNKNRKKGGGVYHEALIDQKKKKRVESAA